MCRVLGPRASDTELQYGTRATPTFNFCLEPSSVPFMPSLLSYLPVLLLLLYFCYCFVLHLCDMGQILDMYENQDIVKNNTAIGAQAVAADDDWEL